MYGGEKQWLGDAFCPHPFPCPMQGWFYTCLQTTQLSSCTVFLFSNEMLPLWFLRTHSLSSSHLLERPFEAKVSVSREFHLSLLLVPP